MLCTATSDISSSSGNINSTAGAFRLSFFLQTISFSYYVSYDFDKDEFNLGSSYFIKVKISSEGTLNKMLFLLLAVASKQKFQEFIFLDDVLTNKT